MKYAHTKRNGVLFVFLNIITVSFFSLYCLTLVAKDVNSFSKKKLPPYWVMWLLGFVTLGIVPIVYEATIAKRVAEKAEEVGVKCTTGFASFFNWTFFGSLIIVGPWIAFGKLYATLNRLLSVLNQKEERAEEEPKVEEEVVPEESADEILAAEGDEPSARLKKKACEPEEEQTPAPKPLPNEPAPRPAPAPSPRPVPAPAKPQETPIRFVAGKSAAPTTPWRVLVDRRTKTYKTFATQEEAIAFAKKLAASRGVGVKVAGSVAETPSED